VTNARATRLGIQAVPFFVIDRSFAGAQDPDYLLGLLRRAWEAREPATVPAAGESWDVDGC
jgi:predicted DsbA family dithiol-disulfide isomerase